MDERGTEDSTDTWDLWIVEIDGGQLERIEQGLTRREAAAYWIVWDVANTDRVVFAWPAGVPLPTIRVADVA